VSTDQLKLTEVATSVTFTPDDMCGGRAAGMGFKDPGSLHSAILSMVLIVANHTNQRILLEKLHSGEKYYYKFGAETGASDTFSFIAPREAGDDTPHSVVVFGDMGVYVCVIINPFNARFRYHPAME